MLWSANLSSLFGAEEAEVPEDLDEAAIARLGLDPSLREESSNIRPSNRSINKIIPIIKGRFVVQSAPASLVLSDEE